MSVRTKQMDRSFPKRASGVRRADIEDSVAAEHGDDEAPSSSTYKGRCDDLPLVLSRDALDDPNTVRDGRMMLRS